MWAVVVAAGSGSRFGGSKQYEMLGGRTVLDWSMTAARSICDGVVVVLPAADVGRRPLPASRPPDAVVAGGDTRTASVRNGLAAVPADATVIVVHDAARPLAGRELFAAVIEAVRGGADGAVCAIPVTDTLRLLAGGTVDRAGLMAVQTPQAFKADVLRAAYASDGSATDDATLVEAAGGRVVVVAGSPRNIKITHPDDVAVAAALAGMPS